jgi:Icc-related predicted phosphoesterase
MKILVLSDLHIEFEAFQIDFSAVDVVILAGDIHIKEHGFKWAADNIKDIPVIYILGNHEFYGKAYPKLISSIKESASNSNIHILEKDILTIDGINFLGCTLWTNFELFGDPRIAGFECQQVMTDFKKIRLSPKFSKLRSIDVAAIHRQSISWLSDELERLDKQTNIVITHHAPSQKSLPEEHKENVISSAYASNLEHLIQKYNPKYWIHGHLHNSSDYQIGETQVICNPRGYPKETNSAFDGRYIINIE